METIREILERALNEVRELHGVQIKCLEVGWDNSMSAVADPDRSAVSSIAIVEAKLTRKGV